MKKLLIGILIFICGNSLMAQDITGSFVGSISVNGNNLELGFNISKAADGSLKSTMDSPDQKAFGIPCNPTTLVNDSLMIGIPAIGGSYKGLWDGKDAISGTFSQGNLKLPLNLKRVTDAEKSASSQPKVYNRPQTPKPPFNYVSEDVEYDNADKSLHFGATFTKPKGDGKFPAVIIITGSGTQDRDGTIFGHKLYWVLADYLTKNGIAVLRVDDRGAGKSTLGNNFRNVTSKDFSYDVEASLNYLESRTDVDKKHVGLIGHSEGGIIAPMVAARRKDVSFIVMWGAPEVGGAVINTEQNAYSLTKSGIDSASVNAFKQLHLQILNLFGSVTGVDDLNKQISPVFDNWKKAQPQKTLDALLVKDNSIVKQDVFKIYDGLYNQPWMRYFISYQPETDLIKVKCAVLAINGEKDTQVNARENLALINNILTKNGNKHFEVKALPGLNHLLQTAKTGDLSEYEQIDETISPAALKIISDWIKIHTK